MQWEAKRRNERTEGGKGKSDTEYRKMAPLNPISFYYTVSIHECSGSMEYRTMWDRFGSGRGGIDCSNSRDWCGGGGSKRRIGTREIGSRMEWE